MPKRFTDGKGRPWDVEIDVVTIGRVRERLKVNLLEVVLPDNTLLEKLADPCLLVDVLFALCEDQAKEKNVSDIDFGKSMTPESIEEGLRGILEGVVNFSPRGVRPAYQKMLDAARKYEMMQAERIKSFVEGAEFTVTLEATMERYLNPPPSLPTESIGDAGSLPELSESSPTTIPLRP
jgi:hypothetical protein